MFKRIFFTLWQGLLLLGISFIILFAIAISALRMALPTLQQHGYLEQIASRLLRNPVHIQQVKTGWYGLQPQIILGQVKLYDQQNGFEKLSIEHVIVGINLLSSLMHWQVVPSQLTLDGVHLAISRNKQGEYFVQGLGLSPHKQSSTRLKTILSWLMAQGAINLTDVQINFLNKLQLSHLSLHLRNNFFEHQFSGRLDISGLKPTQVNVIANIDDSDDYFKQLSGQLYLSVNHLSQNTFEVLKSLLPQIKRVQLQQLSGSVKVWLNLHDSQLQNCLAYYALNRLQTNAMDLKNAVGKIAWNNANQQQNIYWHNIEGQLASAQLGLSGIALGDISLHAHYNSDAGVQQLSLEDLSVNNNDFQISGSVKLNKPATGPLQLAVLAGFQIKQLQELYHYLPQALLSTQVVNQIKQSLLGGSVENGQLLYRGPIEPQAIIDHRAQLQLRAEAQHLHLIYAAQWPAITEGDLALQLEKDRLYFQGHHLLSAGNSIDTVTGKITLMNQPVLNMVLHTKVDLEKAWNFVKLTPLPLAHEVQHMQLQGAANYNFYLKLPLTKDSKQQPQSIGQISMDNAEMMLPQWNLDFTHIQGVLDFYNKSMMDDGNGLTAHLFGNPFHMSIETEVKNKQHTIKINSQGQLSVESLRQHVQLPLAEFFSGQSKIAADLAIHESAERGNDLHVYTDLVGVSSHDVPPLFIKTKEKQSPLFLDVTMGPKKPLYVRVSYNHLAAAALIYHKSPQGLHFYSGDVELGDRERPQFLTESGLLINGFLEKLDWSQWQKFFTVLLRDQQSEQSSSSVKIRALTLQIKQLNFYNHIIKNIRLAIMPLKAAWMAAILSDQYNGLITIPQDIHKRWVFQFKYAHFPEPISSKKPFTINPIVLPPLTINIKNLMVGKQHYGGILLQTEHYERGMHIKKLIINNKNYQLQLHGDWQQAFGDQYTAVFGSLNTPNLGELLKLWKNQSIQGGKGKLSFSFGWPGSPLQIVWSDLTGNASFDFSDGSVIAVDSATEAEIGLGRLLNLLSVDAIVKRLESHFHDLTQKGLWFDRLKGHWVLDHGIATTQDTHFDGPVAKISAHGTLDFAKHTAQMALVVTPQLTSSLPVVVGILGGPVAGVATWVVNKFIGPEINKISQSQYHVTGPWKHLKINKLS